MNNLSQIVETLESNVSRLISELNNLKKENDALRQIKSELEEKVVTQEKTIERLTEENKMVKVANSIVGSKEGKHLTKLKINTLIREIDKCIAQLSE